jgi:hypothetical protein
MEQLLALVPKEIKSLPKTFSTHEFIIQLAQNNQQSYIKALNEKITSSTPFMVLHGAIGKYLAQQTDLIKEIDDKYVDADIFGNKSANNRWERIS